MRVGVLALCATSLPYTAFAHSKHQHEPISKENLDLLEQKWGTDVSVSSLDFMDGN